MIEELDTIILSYKLSVQSTCQNISCRHARHPENRKAVTKIHINHIIGQRINETTSSQNGGRKPVRSIHENNPWNRHRRDQRYDDRSIKGQPVNSRSNGEPKEQEPPGRQVDKLPRVAGDPEPSHLQAFRVETIFSYSHDPLSEFEVCIRVLASKAVRVILSNVQPDAQSLFDSARSVPRLSRMKMNVPNTL